MMVHIVVMGVSGCGKSTFARALAAARAQSFVEGDDFHPQSNIAKMTSGQPLTDDDRAPWLQTLAASLFHAEADGGAVLACSALKVRYRRALRGMTSWPVATVHLTAPPHILAQRMAARDHFMPPSLLASQLETLEPLGVTEWGLTLDATLPPDVLVHHVNSWLDAQGTLAV